MGEIIYSICVGGFLVVAGVIMYAVLAKEEKRLFGSRRQRSGEDDG